MDGGEDTNELNGCRSSGLIKPDCEPDDANGAESKVSLMASCTWQIVPGDAGVMLSTLPSRLTSVSGSSDVLSELYDVPEVDAWRRVESVVVESLS